MQREPASPTALLLFSAGVVVLCLAMGCYFWIKWRVWRAGGRVRFANFGGFAAEFQLLRDYREFAEQHNWSLLPLHGLYACFALGLILMLAATAAK
jgi:hypothetical protein